LDFRDRSPRGAYRTRDGHCVCAGGVIHVKIRSPRAVCFDPNGYL